MSSSYNTFYEQAYIPCVQSSENAIAEAGTGQVNVDGRLIRAGIRINGKCIFGGITTPGQGYQLSSATNINSENIQGPATIFVLSNPNNVAYSAQGSATATTTHAARALRANHL